MSSPRGRAARVAPVALLMLLAAGCATRPPATRGDPPSVSPRDGESEIGLPWRIVGSPDPTELDIVVADGGCDSFRHLTSRVTSTYVVITATGLRANAPACTADLGEARVDLTLEKPLGGKSLRHAPVGPGWRGHDMRRAIALVAQSAKAHPQWGRPPARRVVPW